MRRVAATLLALLASGCLQGYERTVTVHVHDPTAVRVEVMGADGPAVLLPAHDLRDLQVPIPGTSPPVRRPLAGGSGLAVWRHADGAVTLAGGNVYSGRDLLDVDGTSRTYSAHGIFQAVLRPEHGVSLSDGEAHVSCPVVVATGSRGGDRYVDIDLVTPTANVLDARETTEPHRLNGAIMLLAGAGMLVLATVVQTLPTQGKGDALDESILVGTGFVPGALLAGAGLVNLLSPRRDRAVLPADGPR